MPKQSTLPMPKAPTEKSLELCRRASELHQTLSGRYQLSYGEVPTPPLFQLAWMLEVSKALVEQLAEIQAVVGDA